MPSEARRTGFRVLNPLIEVSVVAHGNREEDDTLVGEVLLVLGSLPFELDPLESLGAVSRLTTGGRSLSTHSEVVTTLVVEWLRIKGNVELARAALGFATDVVRYSFTLLDGRDVTRLTDTVAVLCGSASADLEVVRGCVAFFDVLVKYGSVPVASVPLLMCTMCRVVGMEPLSQDSWVVVRNILRSNRGHQAMLVLCSLLEDSRSTGDHPSLIGFSRGIIFFISMACWGSERITTIHYSFSAILPSFLRVLSLGNPLIAYEVLLSVRRLLRKFGERLRSEWDVIFPILFKCTQFLSKGEGLVEKVLLQIITDLEGYVAAGTFSGPRDALTDLVERCAPLRPDESLVAALGYRCERAHPSHADWEVSLAHIVSVFFVNGRRRALRLAVLDQVTELVWVSQTRISTAVDRIILDVLPEVHRDEDPVVRKQGLLTIILFATHSSDFLPEYHGVLSRSLAASQDRDVHVTITTGFCTILSHLFLAPTRATALREHTALFFGSIIQGISSPFVEVRRVAIRFFLDMGCNDRHQLVYGDAVNPLIRFAAPEDAVIRGILSQIHSNVVASEPVDSPAFHSRKEPDAPTSDHTAGDSPPIPRRVIPSTRRSSSPALAVALARGRSSPASPVTPDPDRTAGAGAGQPSSSSPIPGSGGSPMEQQQPQQQQVPKLGRISDATTVSVVSTESAGSDPFGNSGGVGGVGGGGGGSGGLARSGTGLEPTSWAVLPVDKVVKILVQRLSQEPVQEIFELLVGVLTSYVNSVHILEEVDIDAFARALVEGLISGELGALAAKGDGAGKTAWVQVQALQNLDSGHRLLCSLIAYQARISTSTRQAIIDASLKNLHRAILEPAASRGAFKNVVIRCLHTLSITLASQPGMVLRSFPRLLALIESLVAQGLSYMALVEFLDNLLAFDGVVGSVKSGDLVRLVRILADISDLPISEDPPSQQAQQQQPQPQQQQSQAQSQAQSQSQSQTQQPQPQQQQQQPAPSQQQQQQHQPSLSHDLASALDSSSAEASPAVASSPANRPVVPDSVLVPAAEEQPPLQGSNLTPFSSPKRPAAAVPSPVIHSSHSSHSSQPATAVAASQGSWRSLVSSFSYALLGHFFLRLPVGVRRQVVPILAPLLLRRHRARGSRDAGICYDLICKNAAGNLKSSKPPVIRTQDLPDTVCRTWVADMTIITALVTSAGHIQQIFRGPNGAIVISSYVKNRELPSYLDLRELLTLDVVVPPPLLHSSMLSGHEDSPKEKKPLPKTWRPRSTEEEDYDQDGYVDELDQEVSTATEEEDDEDDEEEEEEEEEGRVGAGKLDGDRLTKGSSKLKNVTFVAEAVGAEPPSASAPAPSPAPSSTPTPIQRPVASLRALAGSTAHTISPPRNPNSAGAPITIPVHSSVILSGQMPAPALAQTSVRLSRPQQAAVGLIPDTDVPIPVDPSILAYPIMGALSHGVSASDDATRLWFDRPTPEVLQRVPFEALGAALGNGWASWAGGHPASVAAAAAGGAGSSSGSGAGGSAAVSLSAFSGGGSAGTLGATQSGPGTSSSDSPGDDHVSGLRRSTSFDTGLHAALSGGGIGALGGLHHGAPSLPTAPMMMMMAEGAVESPAGVFLLPGGEALDRALSVLDLVPAVETHSIGVVYIAPGQEDDEEAILKNVHGSPLYTSFLSQLGTIKRLRDFRSAYTGGLDRSEEELDGQFGLFWEDEVRQVMFHVTTLMPNNPQDALGMLKKRHIGNDYVNIVFSDSPQSYNQDTIPGQFNFVHIVIYPVESKQLFRVEVKVKPGVTSSFGPIRGCMVVDKDALGPLVRATAIHADMTVRLIVRERKGQVLVSNKEERASQIQRIAERLGRRG
jgi:hypothetical protein